MNGKSTVYHVFLSVLILIAAPCFAVSPIAVPRTNTISIDGDISDLDARSPSMLDRRENIAYEVQPGKSWLGTNDLSAMVVFNYDDEYLYIGCRVQDNERTHKSRTGNYFNGDGVEIFVSGHFRKNKGSPNSGPLDQQYYFLPPTMPGETLFVYKAKGGERTSSVLSLYGITAATKEFGDHYTMEIRIPLHVAGTKPFHRNIGINIAVDDADGTPYRKTQLSLNGSPNAYMAPKYLESLVFTGSFRRSTGSNFPIAVVAICIGAFILFIGYGIALRFIIVQPIAVKIRITALSAGTLLFCAAIFGISSWGIRHGRDVLSKRIAAAAGIAMSNAQEAFTGRMDLGEFAERLNQYVIGSNVSSLSAYRSIPLTPSIPIIRSVQGTPMHFEPVMHIDWNFTNTIRPIRARGVRIIASGVSAFPKVTNIGSAYRISFIDTNGGRIDYMFTNGVNFFEAGHRFRIGSNAVNSSYVGLNALNPDTGSIMSVSEEHALAFPNIRTIHAISFEKCMPYVTFVLRAITFIDENGEYITGPFIDAKEWHSWQGTPFYRYIAQYNGFDGYRGALDSIAYPFDKSADEFRLQFTGTYDSASRTAIPFGAAVAAIDIRYDDGTIVRTAIIDGLSYSITSEVFGHGHPPHFTSKISRRSISPSGFMAHDKELVIPARAGKAVRSVQFTSLMPETRVTPYGFTAIQRTQGPCALTPLSSDDRMILASAETLVFNNGAILPRHASPEAVSAVRAYADEHPPYKEIDFRVPRIVHAAKGTLIATPLVYRDDISPLALMHFIPFREPILSILLKAVMLLTAFFTFVSLILLAVHVIIDARKLSMKMLAISISLAVIPLTAATALFIFIYNRNAVRDVLAARAALSESFIHADIGATLSSLADTSRRTCDSIVSGSSVPAAGPLYFLIHDVDQTKGTHSVRFSANTPPRFIRVESTRLLKRSGPLLNSAFGPTLAWTTVRTIRGRIISVTAFREMDDAMLAFWAARTKSEISVHFLNGYRHSATLTPSYHISMDRTGRMGEDSERIIAGRPYYLHTFPIKNEMQEEQLLIGTAIDASSFAQTRRIIIIGGIAFALLAGALAFAIAWWFSQRIAGAVISVAGGMKRVETGDLSVSVTVDSRDEIASLADGFNTMAKTLSNLRTTDLQMAAKVQRGLLPALPTSGRYDVAVHYEAYSYVSGDFYDFYTDENGTLTGLVLFDVSGHGVSSGLITTLVRPILYRMFTPDTSIPLSEVIAKANRSIIKAKGDVDNYLTCIMLRFAGEEIQYVNAGHPDLIRKDAASGIQPIQSDGAAVQGAFMGHEGMIEFFEESNHEYRFAMKAGDTFILFTDGLVEARSPENIEFGMENIKRILAEAPPTATAAELIARFVDAGERHRSGAPLSDDITIVVVKIRA